MDAMVRSSPVALLGMVLLAGCATTGQPTPTPTSLVCEPIAWDKPIPETLPPGKWNPGPRPRSYVHIRFVTDGQWVFAVGVPVLNGKAEDPFIVGPMQFIPDGLPENEEAGHAALQKYADWRDFYGALFKAYRHSRPMGLVCPGKDCPITPEGPPPQLFGMTASYSTGGSGALELPESLRAYASLAEAPVRSTATDALRPPAAPAQRSVEQERDRRTLVSDVVTRAVCAARVLAGPP